MNTFLSALTKEILPQLMQALLSSLASSPITVQAIHVTALGGQVTIGPIPIKVSLAQNTPAAPSAPLQQGQVNPSGGPGPVLR